MQLKNLYYSYNIFVQENKPIIYKKLKEKVKTPMMFHASLILLKLRMEDETSILSSLGKLTFFILVSLGSMGFEFVISNLL